MTPKKYALTKAIEKSEGEIILTTDADCRVPRDWVNSMAELVQNSKGIVVGYSRIKSMKSFLNEFQKEQINYSFYLNKIFNIKMGQCADGFLMNTKLLDNIEIFYEKYVKNNSNMFLDDDLWLAIYLHKEKKSSIKNLIYMYREKFGKHVVYSQNSNSKRDGLHLTAHKDGLFLNRRKIQKIEYIKYLIKSLFIKI